MTAIDTLYAAPKAKAAKDADGPANRREYWQEEITKAQKRYGIFERAGSNVVDRYRLERETQAELDLYQDRYNILYSSTETTKTSLYVQTPKVEATKRHPDRTNPILSTAVLLLEAVGQYGLEETDFDGVMKNVVQDYLLPGLGQAWVRYEPVIESTENGEGEEPTERVASESVGVDYVYYKDFKTGVGRVWSELPWVARRVYFDKDKATARFGADKANQLKYSFRPADDGNGNKEFAGSGGAQSEIWEIWDKNKREVVWFSSDYPDDVLDSRPDPLKLKGFFPCPEPIRAVWTTRTFIPKAFYSQYKAQAEELDNLTQRIRYLTKALRVAGVYDGSQDQLKNMLTGNDNKLIAVNNWALFAQQGGIQGSVQWMPIKEIAEVLLSLLSQRDIVKNEIYEITGFSDIVRGVSKASETLGAQKIKADWAGGRLRDMQKEVQRFCRDIIRIMSEIQVEHFSEETLAMYAGFEPPPVTPEEQAATAQYTASMVQYQQQAQAQVTLPGAPPPQMPQAPPPTAQAQAIQQFQQVVELLKNEKQRCALIGIETDSTIAPDEAEERKDRMDFLGAAGAFLQQAGPMAQQYPEMRQLLGSLLMFTVRTFRASRSIEKDFEAFSDAVANAPPAPPPGEGNQGADPAELQAKAAMQQAELAAQAQQAQTDAMTKKYEVDKQFEVDMARVQNEHGYKMAELAIREREVAVKEGALVLDKVIAQADGERADDDQQHAHQMDRTAEAREAAQGSAESEGAGETD